MVVVGLNGSKMTDYAASLVKELAENQVYVKMIVYF